jgi:hypothetical protein
MNALLSTLGGLKGKATNSFKSLKILSLSPSSNFVLSIMQLGS